MLFQIRIFFVELRNLRLHFLNLRFRAVHGHQSVRPENILEQKQEERQREKIPRILPEKRCLASALHPVIHFRASSAISLDFEIDSASA